MLVWFAEQFVDVSLPATLDPALSLRVTRHQLLERSLARQLLFPEDLCQLLDRSRLIRRINYRFKCGFSLFVCHRQGLQFRFVGLQLGLENGRSSNASGPPVFEPFLFRSRNRCFSARVTQNGIRIARLTTNSAISLRALAYLSTLLP